jgi:hypothetical protein
METRVCIAVETISCNRLGPEHYRAPTSEITMPRIGTL